MKEAFTFDDVLIVPKFSTVSSRKEVSLSFEWSHFPYMNLPVISANMDSVTGPVMAKAMMSSGAQAVLHRFCTIEENTQMVQDSVVNGMVPMASIGLGQNELERAEALIHCAITTLVVDVAHGAQMSVVDQVKKLRNIVHSGIGIVVGNFATGQSVRDFIAHLGSNNIQGIKVGIGPGSACTTRIKTGIGYPQLSAVLDVAKELEYSGIAVIADGGMKTPGDIAKALGAGASLCMIGAMLSGTDETPGQIIDMDTGQPIVGYQHEFAWGRLGKKYRGSASKESYEIQGKGVNYRTTEGESFLVPYKGFVQDVLVDIEGGLRSAFSYVGARDIREFHAKTEFVRVSDATKYENGAHGKN